MSSTRRGVLLGAANRRSAVVGPPIPSAQLAWWDNPSPYFATTGAQIDGWTDRVNGLVMTATGATRPLLATYGGINYVSAESPGMYFDLPPTLLWDKRDSGVFIFAKSSSKSTATCGLWNMANSPDLADAVYVNASEVSFYNITFNSATGIFLANNVNGIYRVADAATTVYLGANSQRFTNSVPNTAGLTSGGGWCGSWTPAGVFPLQDMQILGIVVYNRTLTLSETQAVQDWGTAYYRATDRLYDMAQVAVGDSLTAGFPTVEWAESWPAQMLALRPGFDPKLGNSGISGSLMGNGNAPASIAGTYLLRNAGVSTRVVSCLLGRNDFETGATAAAMLAGAQNFVTQTKIIDPGCKIIIGTVFASTFTPVGANAERLAYNVSVNGGLTGADFVLDYAGIPALSNTANPVIFQLDGIHLKPAGYGVMSAANYALMLANSLV